LSKNTIPKSIGCYNEAERVFKIPKDKRNIIIDGSNVAWGNGNKYNGDKPTTKNIKLVVDELKKMGYNNIHIDMDASLQKFLNKPEDSKIFDELKENGYQIEWHQGSADAYIIKHAKEKGAFIITKDTFKEWKEKDVWVKENIDNLCVRHNIKNGKVTLSFPKPK
jgi:hypothetical protein